MKRMIIVCCILISILVIGVVVYQNALKENNNNLILGNRITKTHTKKLKLSAENQYNPFTTIYGYNEKDRNSIVQIEMKSEGIFILGTSGNLKSVSIIQGKKKTEMSNRKIAMQVKKNEIIYIQIDGKLKHLELEPNLIKKKEGKLDTIDNRTVICTGEDKFFMNLEKTENINIKIVSIIGDDLNKYEVKIMRLYTGNSEVVYHKEKKEVNINEFKLKKGKYQVILKARKGIVYSLVLS